MHFTDNVMVAELHEINVEHIRGILNENAEALESLWKKLLPGALLLLFNQKCLKLPYFMAQKPWKEVA